jgi:hypothetical protein
VSYDDISGISNNTWQFQINNPAGYVYLTTPHGRTFVSGSLNVEAKSTVPNTASLTYQVVNPTAQGKVVKSGGCAGTDCVSVLDTTTVADGAYQIYATAAAGSSYNSEHEQLFVVNGTPNLTMTYTFTGGVDATKPLSGRPVMDLKTDTGISGVPMSRIVFHAAQNGKDVFMRDSQIVLPDMTFGWRTTVVPNGAYDIFYTGELITAQGKKATVESSHMSVTVQN